MHRILRIVGLLLLVSMRAHAQYISFAEPVPYACPNLCAGGTLDLKTPQILTLPLGDTLQALLSDANGSFTSGTRVLPSVAWANFGSNVFTAQPYIFNGNAFDIVLRVVIPAGIPAGSQYKLKMRSSSGYVSPDLMRCPSSGNINILPVGTPLPTLPPNSVGDGKWIGSYFTWISDGTQLFTPALVAQQDFFNPSRYQGYAVYDNLNFDLTLTGGAPGTVNNGTSFSCGFSLLTNYAIRFRRRENFDPGYYKFTIGADDGVRISVDGGNTWLLSSFIEQQYFSSVKTTDSEYPNGVCLAGPTDLVVEYFQRPQEARVTFNVTKLSGAASFQQPVSQEVCTRQPVSFTLGAGASNNSFQWQISRDSGRTFTNIANDTLYSGATLPTLSLVQASPYLNGALFRCLFTNACLSQIPSDTVLLTIKPGAQLVRQPVALNLCGGVPAAFSVEAAGANLSYQWQINTGSGFRDIETADFIGIRTDSLSNLNPGAYLDGAWVRCRITGSCTQPVLSDSVRLRISSPARLVTDAVDQILCNTPATFSVLAQGPTLSYAWEQSRDGGTSWQALSDVAPFQGSSTASLTVAQVPGLNQTLYRARITGGCGDPVLSRAAMLTQCPDTCVFRPVANIITANGDDQNNTLLETSNCAFTEFSLKVYNRWGREVFASTDADQVWTGDGVPTGTYYYRLTYSLNGSSEQKGGFVELVR